jgi:hypothetical protein
MLPQPVEMSSKNRDNLLKFRELHSFREIISSV